MAAVVNPALPPIPALPSIFANFDNVGFDSSFVGVLVNFPQSNVQLTPDLDFQSFCNSLVNLDRNLNVWAFDSIPFHVDANNPTVNLTVLPVYYNILVDLRISPLLSNRHKWLLKGQSGIGKSLFFVVLAKVLMDLRRPFIWSHVVGTGIIYYYWEYDPLNPNGRCGTLAPNDMTAFDDPDVTWMMDQVEHGPYVIASCRMILAASDNRNHFKDFVKLGNVLSVVMPLPSEVDCARVLSNCDVAIQNAFEVRYAQFGPVLRVLCDISTVIYASDQARALNSVPYWTIVSPTETIVGEDHSHSIFYTSGVAQFKELPRQFGSDHIKAEFTRRWRTFREDKLNEFLLSTDTDNAVKRGHVFEADCHTILSTIPLPPHRTILRMKKMHGVNQAANIANQNNIRTGNWAIVTGKGIIARPMHVVPSNRSTFLPIPIDSYCKPQYGNYGAVDSFVLHGPGSRYDADLFQISMTVQHGCNAVELSNVITRVDAYFANIAQQQAGQHVPRPIRLFFVVPADRIPTNNQQLQRQAYVGLIPDEQLNRVEQYFLTIG